MGARGKNTQIDGEHHVQGHVQDLLLGEEEAQPIWVNRTGATIRVTKVDFVVGDPGVGGDDSNTMALTLQRRTVGGSDDDVTIQKAYTSGVDINSGDPDDLPLSATLTDRDIADGQVLLLLKQNTAGSGALMPKGEVVVHFIYV